MNKGKVSVANKPDEHKGKGLRATLQPVMPQRLSTAASAGTYDIYPYHRIGKNKIFTGYETLANWIVTNKTVLIDGYLGVCWQDIKEQLSGILDRRNLTVKWVCMEDYLKPAAEIDELVAPFLGEEDAVWGTKTHLSLSDFFGMEQLIFAREDFSEQLTIVMGPGAALLEWEAAVVYIDFPKNELQYRMRAGAVLNLGAQVPYASTQMYKRFYFVDWVVLNRHKQAILDRINIFADNQWNDTVSWAQAAAIKAGLEEMAHTVFRCRPWFEPGAWGGQWMKRHIQGLNQETVNYAWSFELITAENGIVFESDQNLLELSFDSIMFLHYQSILGKHAALFKYEFPIRFDFLDTYDGGNLSIQCHPSLSYIQHNFGETITQDETYYILDCNERASVYLGFQEGIKKDEFRAVLENSQSRHEEVVIEHYVQRHKAGKHELFLIPNGTIHSAGEGSLILEISAAPYIFTFKMYDWLRVDLNGDPRPINISHAFHNLRFERRGAYVKQHLIAQPEVIAQGAGWEIIHLPTHPEHFYDVNRLEFDQEILVDTHDTCHVLMLVEGTSIEVVTGETMRVFNYGETFIIPAGARQYKLINRSTSRSKVIKAFIKDEAATIILKA